MSLLFYTNGVLDIVMDYLILCLRKELDYIVNVISALFQFSLLKSVNELMTSRITLQLIFFFGCVFLGGELN